MSGLKGVTPMFLGQKLINFYYQFLHSFYYRHVFGRETPLAKQLAPIVYSWEMRRKKGDIPIHGEEWEKQYLFGKWKFMNQIDELALYSVIVGYIEYLKPGGAILDVGCGEGILFKKNTSTWILQVSWN
jgi:hypothetical protein